MNTMEEFIISMITNIFDCTKIKIKINVNC